MPGGERLFRSALCLRALQIALTEKAAAANGQDAAGLLPAAALGLLHIGVRVAGDVVDDYGEAALDVAGDMGPDNDDRSDSEHQGKEKPPLFDPGRPGDDDEEAQIDQDHAEVPGDHGDEGRHKEGVPGQLHHRGETADAPVLELAALKG